MSEVVALSIGSTKPELNRAKIKLKLLETKGVVTESLLKEIWGKRLPPEHRFFSTHPLFVMLEQYGLLYPLSKKLYNVLLSSTERSEDAEMTFLVPFKLPGKPRNVPFSKVGCGTFVVDFMSYLPYEVYSHLVIRFLQCLNSQEGTKENHILLADTLCKFMHVNVSDVCADWLLEIDKATHTLTVSFK